MRVVTLPNMPDMYIITLKDHPEGVYSVYDDDEERVIPIFEEEDDADRYLFMMEDDDENPPLQVVELDSDVIIEACESRGQRYSIITSDDFLIPPDDLE